MNEPFRCYRRTVLGQSDLLKAVAELATWSAWFSVEPLPDDAYEISVKEEHQERLNELVDFVL